MDSKFYISYEAARLLKEKGYERSVNRYYSENGFLHDLAYDENYDLSMSNNDLDLDHYAAPTKAEAIDWLESKGVIVIAYYCHGEWLYLITPLLNEIEDKLIKKVFIRESFTTRLEAEDALIIKACELL